MKLLKRAAIFLLIIMASAALAVYILLTKYQNEIKNELVETLRTKYEVDLRVGDVNVSFFSNWPHASMQLRDVTMIKKGVHVDSTLYINARSIALSFNLRKLMDKQFIVRSTAIRDAEIFIRKDTGYVPPPDPNQIVKKEDESEPMHFDLKTVTLIRTKIRFTNPAKGQRIAFELVDNKIRLRLSEEGATAHLTGKMFFEGLLFKPNRGTFLRNCRTEVDFYAAWLKDEKVLSFRPPSNVTIDDETYNLSALVNLNEKRNMALRITGKQIKYEKAAALLTDRIRKKLSNFTVRKPFDANVLLVTSLNKRQDPGLIIHLSGTHSDLEIGTSKVPYSDITFHGRLVSIDSTRSHGDNENATLVFYPLRGKVYGHQFNGSVRLKDLVTPNLLISGKLNVDVSKVKLDSSTGLNLQGIATATVHYEGPASCVNRRDFLEPPMKLRVKVSADNIRYRERSRQYEYVINGTGDLDNHDLKLNGLSVGTQVANFKVSGKISNFMEFALGNQPGFSASLRASTKKMDLSKLLGQKPPADSSVVVSELPVIPVSEPAANTNATNDLLEKFDKKGFRFKVHLEADSLYARDLRASDVRSDMFYVREFLDIRFMRMSTCEGELEASAQLRNFNRLNAKISVDDVEVKQLFTQFGNFGQDRITADNLQGKISVTSVFNSYLSDTWGVIPETMSGEVSLRVRDGHLVNFAPIQNLSNFLFRNRDFNDVRFSEISETFDINGTALRIRELEVASSLLNLYVVSGIYNFRGMSTLNILLPWSNLKRRGKHYIPQNSGQSAENTKGIKLSFHGPPGQLKISLGYKEIQEGRTSL